MGLISSIKSVYKKADQKLGGYLPGGVTPQEVKSANTSTSTSSISGTSSVSTSQNTTPSSPSSSGGGSGQTSGFSGKVEEIDTKTGETIDTKYYYENQEVGRISGSGSSATYTPVGDKSAVLTFNRGTTSEQVKLTPEEVQIQKSILQPQNQPSQPYADYGFRLDTEPRGQGLSYESFGGISGALGGMSITQGGKNYQSYGVPIITQSEAKKYGINEKTTPVWILKSTDMDGGINEALYAGTTPYTIRAIPTTDLVVSNLANIRAGQEIYRRGKSGEDLTNVQLGEVYSGAVVQAKQNYKELPLNKRVGYYGVGVVQGITSIAIKTQEFIVQETMIFGAGKPVGFQYGGDIGEMANYPTARSKGFIESPGTFIKETIQSPSNVGSLGIVAIGTAAFASRVRNVGAYEASAEAASVFSPLRMSNRIYGTTFTPETKITNIQSIRYTNTEGVTSRRYTGGYKDLTIYGEEEFTSINGKIVGKGLVTTQAPITEVRAGGAILESGVRATYQPYEFRSGSMGKGYEARSDYLVTERLSEEFPGGTSKVITSRGITAYEFQNKLIIQENLNKGIRTTTGGIISSTDKPINTFISGRAKGIYKTEFIGGISQDFIYFPSGKYKVTPRFAGVEIDLNKYYRGGNKGYTSFSGGGSKSSPEFFKQLYATNEVPLPSPTIQQQAIRQSSVRTTIITKPSLSNTQSQLLEPDYPSYVGGTQTYALTSSIIVVPEVVTSTIEQTKGTSRIGGGMISIGALGLGSALEPRPTQIPEISQIEISKTSQITRQGLIMSFSNAFPTFPSPRNTIPPTTPPAIPPLFLISSLDNFTPSNVIKGGQRVTEYTPSFTALVFRIGGTYKRGGAISKSGIDFRPITPGFKFNTGLQGFRKLLRVR